MLVLTRRAGESVRIGDDVTVTVLDVRGDVVRVGIQAPRALPVHRDEVYRELRNANREAVVSDDRVANDLGAAVRAALHRAEGPGGGSATAG